MPQKKFYDIIVLPLVSMCIQLYFTTDTHFWYHTKSQTFENVLKTWLFVWSFNQIAVFGLEKLPAAQTVLWSHPDWETCDVKNILRHVMWNETSDMWYEMKRVTCDMKWYSDMWCEKWDMWCEKNDMLNEMKDMLCEMISDRLFDVDRLFEETVYLLATVN